MKSNNLVLINKKEVAKNCFEPNNIYKYAVETELLPFYTKIDESYYSNNIKNMLSGSHL